MKRAYILPVSAVLGVCIAIVAVVYANRPPTRHTSQPLTPQVPYSSYIAGAGLVEASTGNIAVASPVAGVVREIIVKVGEHVEPGDALFKIDDRDLQAQRVTAVAKVKEATASLQKPRHRYDYARDLRRRDPNSVSKQDLTALHDDVDMAQAALDVAQAQVKQIRMEIERRTVRAPVASEILQLKMRVGEYIDSSSVSEPLLILGGGDRFNVRVNIDEYDARRFRTDADAVAFLRGDPSQKIPLRYEYTEPYIVPKNVSTGSPTERTDSRVLQVIYSFDHHNLPVYVGQLLDVYVQGPPFNGNNSGPDH
ncbi:MAG: efflux RND transporter periplasmic adaptor subunit [Gammaproteobacteria bacterium]|jgi:RND family efflux transporter MFP subunit